MLKDNEKPTHVLALNTANTLALHPKARILVLRDTDFPPPVPLEYNVAVVKDYRSDLEQGGIHNEVRLRLKSIFSARAGIEGPDALFGLQESVARLNSGTIARLREEGWNVVVRHDRGGSVMNGRVTPEGLDVGDAATLIEVLVNVSRTLSTGARLMIDPAVVCGQKVLRRCNRRSFKGTFKLSSIEHNGQAYVRIDGQRTMAHRFATYPPAVHSPMLIVGTGDYAGLMLMGSKADMQAMHIFYPEAFCGSPEAIEAIEV